MVIDKHSGDLDMAPDSTRPPSSSWVRLLRTYGPTSNNLSMFDEYVSDAVIKAKVNPIKISTPQLDKMFEHIQLKNQGSILIAGVAGDGKTYHCRALWELCGGDIKVWASEGQIKEINLTDGRKAIFIKDLSECNNAESDEALQRLERSVLGDNNTEIIILAANHGQILTRLRDFGDRQGRVHPLRKPLQDYFLQSGEAPARLAVFDLSRSAGRKTLEEVIAAVTGHEGWNSCTRCTLRAGGKVCPIYENRGRLLGENNNSQLAKRLGNLVEIARLNGLHLPVRDLLALCANTILGHQDSKEGLMSCGEVAKIQELGTIDRANVYGNIFGSNLPKRRTTERPVFMAMKAFGIGEETTNGVDGLLVYGSDDDKLKESFDRLVGIDAVYGATQSFKKAQDKYLEGDETARLEGGAAMFIELLQTQRRRLFFTLPEDEPGYQPWSMTAFRFAGEYLEMRSALLSKEQVSETIRIRLVRGLNRVMTGLLIDNGDRIFVASSGGFTQSRVSVLCDTEAPARRSSSNGIGMLIRIDQQTGRPMLDVSLAQGAGNSVKFDLTPVRYEFISRVSEGSLPGSFSNECLEDMLAFKAKLLRKAELIRKQSLSHEEEDLEVENQSLTLNFIDVEQGGHAFSRPITVIISE